MVKARCLARLEDQVTKAGVLGHSLLGTQVHMFPQLLDRIGSGAARALWVLGAFLYEIISSRRPFEEQITADSVGAIQAWRWKGLGLRRNYARGRRFESSLSRRELNGLKPAHDFRLLPRNLVEVTAEPPTESQADEVP